MGGQVDLQSLPMNMDHEIYTLAPHKTVGHNVAASDWLQNANKYCAKVRKN